MKYITSMSYLLLLALLLFSGFSMLKDQKYTPDKDEQAVNCVISRGAKALKEKYNILPSGTTVAMPEGDIQILGIDFHVQGPKTKDQIRELLIHASEDFLDIINTDADLRPYLKRYPFTIENVEIELFFKDQKGYGIRNPDISVAGIQEGKLDYEVFENTTPEKGYLLTVSHTFETYQEALNLMHPKQ